MLRESDLRIESYSPGRAHGMTVYSSIYSSAVRITHIPTGIQVIKYSHHFQWENKNDALIELEERLGSINLTKREAL